MRRAAAQCCLARGELCGEHVRASQSASSTGLLPAALAARFSLQVGFCLVKIQLLGCK